MSHDIYMKVTQQSHNAHGDHVILHNSHMTYLLATMKKNRIPKATYPMLLHTLLKALQIRGMEYNFVSMSLIQFIPVVRMQEVFHKEYTKTTKMSSLHTSIHAILILGLRPS